VFVAVMRLGSVTAAAQHLGMSQPSVSKYIGLAERRLGFQLFERIKGRLTPTAEARLMFEETARVQEYMSRFDRFLQNVRQYKSGQLRVCATPSLAISMLPIAARAFRAAHPDYGLVLDMQGNHEIPQLIEHEQYDLGFIVIPSSDETEEMTVISRGTIVCVLPDHHPQAKRRTVAWSQLDARELIYITTDIRLVELMSREIPEFSRRSPAAIETNRYTTAVNLVKQGLGLTLVDQFTLIGVDPDRIAVKKLTPTLPVSLVAIIGRGHSNQRSAHHFVEVMQGIATEAG